MADETSVAAGKRFSQDLRRIREDREVSIDEVHKETRIARTLIESFEEGGLYNHETFNEVYLRSFVRAYAEAVGISPDVVREELDAALDGTYQHALAENYLGISPADPDDGSVPPEGEKPSDSSFSEEETDLDPPDSAEPEPPSAGGPEGRGGIVGPARAIGTEPDDTEPDDEEENDESSSSASSEADGQDPSPAEDESQSDEEGAKSAEEPSAPTDKSEDTLDDPSSEEPPPDTENTAESADDSSEGLPDDRRPSWMENDKSDDQESLENGARQATQAAGGEASPSLPGGAESTGIVGEPTALGSDSEDPPLRDPDSSPTREGHRRSDRSTSLWDRLIGAQHREVLWAGVGFVVVLFVLLGLGVAFFSAGPEPGSQEAATAPDTAATSSVPDTASADTAAGSRPPPANVTLGSSIPLTILATGNVQGIRIERDEDLERPYWIQEGEAAVFPFQEQVTLQNELDNVQLFLAGFPYPERVWASEEPVVITRSDVEAFVDTLRGAPATLSASPDTIPKGPPDQDQ